MYGQCNRQSQKIDIFFSTLNNFKKRIKNYQRNEWSPVKCPKMPVINIGKIGKCPENSSSGAKFSRISSFTNQIHHQSSNGGNCSRSITPSHWVKFSKK